jgi:hypothetical protein
MLKREKYYGYLTLAVAVVQFLIQLGSVAQGEDFIVTALNTDDTFYYLLTSWNLHRYGMVTFDGLHATNGVQFLWFWILAALAAVTPTKTALLTATMVLVAALNAACHYPLWRIGRTVGRPGLALALAVPLFYLNIASNTYLLAMENSLHLLVLLVLAAALLTAIRHARRLEMTGREVVGVAALMALAVWVRLDSALYVGLLYGYLLWLYVKRNPYWSWQPILASGLVAGGMAGVMFVGFYVMGHTVLPVSGLIKQSMFNEGFGHYLPTVTARVFEQTTPAFEEFLTIARSVRGGQGMPWLHLGFALALAAAIFLPWLVLEVRYRRSPYRRSGKPGWWATLSPVGELYAVLMVTILPHLVYISSFPLYMTWYRSPQMMLAILTTGLVIHRIGWLVREALTEALADGLIPVRRVGLAAVSMVTGCLVLSGLSLGRDSLFMLKPLPMYSERLAIARWIDDQLAPDVTLASWNAGLLGYYSNRKLINLDGLVNDEDFFENVLSKHLVALPDYLRQNGVSLLIDHTIYDVRVTERFVPVDISSHFNIIRLFRAQDARLMPDSVQALVRTERGVF